MKPEITTDDATYVSRSLAGEDLKCGDFVAILHEIVEWPSFYWSCDSQLLPPEQPIRLLSRGSEGGTPLRVKAICLPFVFVKKPCGHCLTLDVRQHRLVRLCPEYARVVWKAMKKRSRPKITI